MLRLAANLSYLFTERPFLDRFEAATGSATEFENQSPFAWRMRIRVSSTTTKACLEKFMS